MDHSNEFFFVDYSVFSDDDGEVTIDDENFHCYFVITSINNSII